MATAKEVNADLGELRAEFAGFRGRVETELGLFRSIAKGIADKLVALIVAVFVGMAGVIGGAFVVGWQLSALNSEVKVQGSRLDDLKSESKAHGERLDKIEGKLDAIIRQTAPAPKPGG